MMNHVINKTLSSPLKEVIVNYLILTIIMMVTGAALIRASLVYNKASEKYASGIRDFSVMNTLRRSSSAGVIYFTILIFVVFALVGTIEYSTL